MATLNKYAIIVAGGKGLRMGTDLPKQFLELHGKPVLFHTISAFIDEDRHTSIILVLPESHFSYWHSISKDIEFSSTIKLVKGGDTRFQSVSNGLNSIKEDAGLVAIHDGVRPLIDGRIIRKSYNEAEKYGSAIVAVPSKDSLRVKSGSTISAVNREDYYLVQTPQTFRLEEIKKAFKVDEKPFFTDDASVYEYAGGSIHLIDGSYRNIKITTKEDLLIADVMISK